MDPYELSLILMAMIAILIASLTWRGLKAGRRPHAATARFYRYSRGQRLVTFCVLVPLVAFIALLPYTFLPFEDNSDVLVSVFLTAGCGLALVEAKNRLVVTSPEGISSGSWQFPESPLTWAGIRRVTFHDTFGGYFIVQHSMGRLYIPVQVDRPLDLIRDLETHVPPVALLSAKKGIQICRQHLS